MKSMLRLTRVISADTGSGPSLATRQGRIHLKGAYDGYLSGEGFRPGSRRVDVIVFGRRIISAGLFPGLGQAENLDEFPPCGGGDTPGGGSLPPCCQHGCGHLAEESPAVFRRHRGPGDDGLQLFGRSGLEHQHFARLQGQIDRGLRPPPAGRATDS